MFSYFFWWSKPYNVQIAIKLEPKGEFPWRAVTEELSDRVASDVSLDSEGTQTWRNDIGWLVYVLVLLAGFGAIHVAAWDFSFPSVPEGVCWKVAAVISTTWSLFLVFYLLLPDRVWFFDGSSCDHIALGCLILVYPIARLFLLVEAFVSLRASPAGVYDTVIVANFVF